MNLLNRDFRQMKIAGQHTPFWGGQHGRFLHFNFMVKFNTVQLTCLASSVNNAVILQIGI